MDGTSGRITAVRASTDATTDYYARNMSYWPSGALKEMKYETKGAGAPTVWEQRCYNGRNQMTAVRVANATATDCANTTAGIFYSSYTYGTRAANNGNVMAGTIGRWVSGSSLSWTQSYSYDTRNRLTGVTDSAYTQGFLYDPSGNRALNANAGQTTYNPEMATFVPTATDVAGVLAVFSRNRWNGNVHDSAGNVTGVNSNSYQYTYDAESRMVTSAVPGSSITASYEYDGTGKRVRKTVNGQHWLYVYDAPGALAAEYPASGQAATWTGRRYVMGDMLGSARMSMTDAGAVVECMDYTPFGTEIQRSLRGNMGCYLVNPTNKVPPGTPPVSGEVQPGNGVNEQFTSQVRDSETGLDYFGARYMSAAQGRFGSPDMATGDRMRPQTFNSYQYALNNPLRFVDPSGHYEEDVHFDLTYRSNIRPGPCRGAVPFGVICGRFR